MLPSPETQPTMTVEEAGKALGVSCATAYEAVRSGDLPSIRVGRRWLVPTAALRRMVLLDADIRGPAA